jgi:hypothetical protein
VNITLSVDEETLARARKLAEEQGTSVDELIQAYLESLAREPSAESQPYRLRPASLGAVRRGVDLDKTLSLADALEDEELARKLELRK